ncbi:MAG: hypothetical protein EP332_13245 [Bacteroidetes bacterium]|nr:MAG: hypothetical protein EP332_13245 [Bacteroidota bacterium]
MTKDKLDQVLTYASLIIALILLKTQSGLLENTIRGKSFAIQFMSLSIMPAGLWFFKRVAAYRGTEKKEKRLLAQCFSILFLGLFAAASINTWTAQSDSEVKKAFVSKHGGFSEFRNQNYIHLVIEGKDERFNPDPKSYKSFSQGDSIEILVGHGILGYDCILEFRPGTHAKRQ